MLIDTPTDSDAPVLQGWLADDGLMALVKVEPPRPDRPMAIWLIRLDDGTPVGWMELFNIDTANLSAEAGIAIPDPRGRGLAPIAGMRLLGAAFGTWGFRRIACRALASNEDAIRCAELFGFVREGVDRQAVLRDGKFVDVVRFGMLREEFLGKRVIQHGDSSTIRQRGAGDSKRDQEPRNPCDAEDARGPANAVLG